MDCRALEPREGRYDDTYPIGVRDVTILSNLFLDRILGIPLLLAIVAFYSFDFCLRVGGIVSLSPHGASVTHRMINGLDHPFLFPCLFYTN